jgi:cystathionine beta-synthase
MAGARHLTWPSRTAGPRLGGAVEAASWSITLRLVAREYPTVLELVGGTPIVRLDRIGRDVKPRLLAKLEFLNPGGSVKDRIGLAMIEAAEREGKLRPGGTIVEPTSGNTGVGLAIAAARKDYRCIFAMPDKMSQEKIAMLRAYGAEVVITPTAVEPESPESYYSVSSRLAEEIPGGFKPDQYSNEANPRAHYEQTGPEIWEQTGGEVDAIVISVGTGGTITGVGRYFKERKPEVLIVGADPEGSVFTARDDKDVQPYLVEGIGKDTWPQTLDASVVDEWVRVSDRDSFLTARRLAREEGLLVGGSSGTTLHAALVLAERFGPEATILTMLPDSGRSYLSKFLDDNWMLEHGFLERRAPAPTVEELLRSKRVEEAAVPALVTVSSQQKVGEAIDLMQRYSISQLPVIRDGELDSLADIIGSLQDRDLLDRVFRNPDALHQEVAAAMQPPLSAVEASDTLDEVFATLSGRTSAVVVARGGRPVGVITRSDLLEYLAHNRDSGAPSPA